MQSDLYMNRPGMSAIMDKVEFAEELNLVLPADLPNREIVIRKAAGHLDLIVEVNRHMNLTRIVSPREAAIKHVLDSVLPWRLFADARHVLDAGTGAGFPGIPLALVLPDVRFTLAESTQKKAHFVESVLARLNLPNVTVSSMRAEELALDGKVNVITARALAPIPKALVLLAPSLKKGAKALLYKGPDAVQEIASAAGEMKKLHLEADVVLRYELPGALGARTIVELRRAKA
jgi:16S rRNA (guanine527-N7)-methyltransferase